MKVFVLTYYDPFERYAFTNFNKAIEHFYNKIISYKIEKRAMYMIQDFIYTQKDKKVIQTQTNKTLVEYIFSIQTPEEFNGIFGEDADIVALDVL